MFFSVVISVCSVPVWKLPFSDVKALVSLQNRTRPPSGALILFIDCNGLASHLQLCYFHAQGKQWAVALGSTVWVNFHSLI